LLYATMGGETPHIFSQVDISEALVVLQDAENLFINIIHFFHILVIIR